MLIIYNYDLKFNKKVLKDHLQCDTNLLQIYGFFSQKATF